MAVPMQQAPADPIDAAIERLRAGDSATPVQQTEPDPAQISDYEERQAAIRARMAAELEADPPPADLSGTKQGSQPLADKETLINGAPADLWTLDDMEAVAPLHCFYDGDPNKPFTARPLLYTPYCQKRFELIKEYQRTNGQGKATYAKACVAYADIVWHCMSGCSWTVRRRVRDEDGELVMDDKGNLLTEPMPLSRDSVDACPLTVLTGFINGILKAMSGEVSGQP